MSEVNNIDHLSERQARRLSILLGEIMANAKQIIFVVDDDKLIASSLSELFRIEEFNSEAFYDARSALQRASDCLPDVLVTDVNMPKVDGITLAKEIRKRNPVCKVIIMTGKLRVKTPEDLQTDGLDGFALLLKPFTSSQLLRLVKSAMAEVAPEPQPSPA
jgi:two-component system C4-dicarboxylate transport response regulator DctD